MISIDHGTASLDVISDLSGSDCSVEMLELASRELYEISVIIYLIELNCMHVLESYLGKH